MSEQESGKVNLGRVLIALIFIVGGIAIYLTSQNGKKDPGGNDPDAKTKNNLALTRTALAITENMEPSDAEAAWAPLAKAFPRDPSVALNRALNRVLLVDVLYDQATNPLLTDAEKSAARQKLPDAITMARNGISQFNEIAKAPIKSLWLQSRVDLREAALLEVMSKSLRRGIFDRLTEALAGELGRDPEAVILGGPLSEVVELLEDPIDGLPKELLAKAAASIGALSNQHTDNLFLAVRAARLNIEAKNEASNEFVDRSAKLARAINPLLNEMTKPIGITPAELVTKILSAIAEQNWSEAGIRMQQYFNVLNPTEILKTDRRRASPHPLDRLSFDTLRRLSAEAILADPVEKGNAEIEFESSEIAESSDVLTIQTIDFDMDLVSDLAAITNAKKIQLWKNNAGNWSRSGELELDIQPLGLIVADLFMVDSSNPNRIKSDSESTETEAQDYSTSGRHNTFPGLIAYADDGIRLIALDGRKTTGDDQRMKVIEQESELADVQGAQHVVTGDLEGDGDLDLIVATKENGIRLFINRGNRTFFEVTDLEAGFDSANPVIDMAIADIDRDLDLDVVTLHRDGHVGILENLLHLQFRGRIIDEIAAKPSNTSLAIADVDGNVSWDIVISGAKETAIVFSQTAEAGIWTVERTVTEQTAMPNAIVADLDNDSWSELVAADTAGGRYIRLGPWGLNPPTESQTIKTSTGQLQVADFDADGKLDLAAVRDGKIQVAINQTDTPDHFIDVRFKGIADNAANSGRVNHFAIGSVLELRFGPHYRSEIITTPVTHLATGRYDAASSVRVIFPNGLTQTIRDPDIDTIVEEEQSLKGSCPYLYAWDGEKFVFMTDCLWAAPLGLQVARGVVAKDRPWEYLKLDGRHIKPRDGRYEFRMTEELWEVCYVDHVDLTTVDHPEDVQVWTNEKVGPAEIAKQTVFAFRDSELHVAETAVDTTGRDVTAQLRQRDGDFVQGFDRRLRQGLCRPHWIDLNFGDATINANVDPSPSIYLVLTGWILPTDTSLNIQIDQNPELPPIEFPSVWVPDAGEPDGWRIAIPFMGFPGGKTKTIVVDVTDVINQDDPRLRIRTSAQIYWDDAQLAVQTEPAPFKQQSTQLLDAELAYHGYSQSITKDSRTPDSYDYQQARESPKWPPLRGSLTQFGPCLELVREWDDRMVVMGSGDELRISFAVPQSPVPTGWKRDFVLHCVGWDKDADLNTLAGQTTGPLPHRKMGQYPPTAAGQAELERVEQKNRDHRQRHQSFRAFWRRGDAEAPRRFLSTAASSY